MKKQILLIVLMLIFTFCACGQNDAPQVGDAYRFKAPLTLDETSVIGIDFNPANSQSIPVNAKGSIVTITTDGYVLFIWDWPNNTKVVNGEANNSKRNRLNFNGTTHRFFKVPKGLLTGNLVKLYRRLSPTFGAITYPLKYRPQTGRFEKSFSISLTGGYTCLFRKIDPEHSLGVMAGVGVGSVTISPDDADPTILLKEEDRPAAMLSLNFIYIHKALQVGLSVGIDKLIGKNDLSWKYDGRGWISFGIGANLFTVHKPSAQKGNDQ